MTQLLHHLGRTVVLLPDWLVVHLTFLRWKSQVFFEAGNAIRILFLTFYGNQIVILIMYIT